MALRTAGILVAGASLVAGTKVSSFEQGAKFDKCIKITDWVSMTLDDDIVLADKGWDKVSIIANHSESQAFLKTPTESYNIKGLFPMMSRKLKRRASTAGITQSSSSSSKGGPSFARWQASPTISAWCWLLR